MIIRKIKVNEYEYQPPINYVAGATEPDIQFQLTDYVIPSGAEARAFVQRFDGTFEYTVATIDDQNITIEPTGSMFSVKGAGAIQVTLYVGDEVVKNFSVPVFVHADLADDAAQEGRDIVSIFHESEQAALEQFRDDAEEIAEEVTESIPSDYTALSNEVDELNERLTAIEHGAGLTDEIKQALLQLAEKITYIDDNGQDYYDALEGALYPEAELVSVSAEYTQSGTVYATDELSVLKDDLVVTAHYSDSSTSRVTTYTLSGTLTEGTSTVTVNYSGKTTTFDVTVTRYKLYDYIYNSLAYSSSASWNEYVDTGLKYSPTFSTLNLEYECMNSNDVNASCVLMGAGYNYSNNNASFIWYARANKGGFSAYYFKTAKQLNTAPGDTRCVCKYVFVDGGQSYMQYDSTVVDIATVSASAITPSNDSLILAGSYQTDGSRKYGMPGGAKAKLGYVKFTDPITSNLVYHFIPAHDLVADKYGFYEAVNNIFYPSNGSDYRCDYWGA